MSKQYAICENCPCILTDNMIPDVCGVTEETVTVKSIRVDDNESAMLLAVQIEKCPVQYIQLRDGHKLRMTYGESTQ